MALYRTLTDVAMRLACLQDEDIDKANLATHATFQMILELVGQWPSAFARLSGVAKREAKSLAKEVEQESNRLKPEENKPVYAEGLKLLLEALKALPF
jgi:hypothetical protein